MTSRPDTEPETDGAPPHSFRLLCNLVWTKISNNTTYLCLDSVGIFWSFVLFLLWLLWHLGFVVISVPKLPTFIFNRSSDFQNELQSEEVSRAQKSSCEWTPGSFCDFLWDKHKLLNDPCPLRCGPSTRPFGGESGNVPFNVWVAKGEGGFLSGLIWIRVSSKRGPSTKTGLWNWPNGSSLIHANELFIPEETLSGNVQSAGALPDTGLILASFSSLW